MPVTELLYKAAMSVQAGNISVINARAHSLLAELCHQRGEYMLTQAFKPEYNALSKLGLSPGPASKHEFDLVLLLPSKNRMQTHAWMAEAMMQLGHGGKFIMACANRHGARAYESALSRLAGNTSSSSKSKCRVFSARKSENFDASLASQWIELAKAQRIESHGLISQAGLFSWDRPDPGSQLLLDHLPKTLAGTGMDLCCGYGLLSEHILRSSSAIDTLHLIEADRLALDCAKQNTARWQSNISYHWLDAANETLPKGLDWVVCNPPFHSGQDRDIGLGQSIVSRACQSLKCGGSLYLVANRKLPYEQTLSKHLKHYRTVIETAGFKIIQARR